MRLTARFSYIFLAVAFLFFAWHSAEAQKLPKVKKPKKNKRESALAMDSLSATMAPTINLEEEEEEGKSVKKRKRKKKVFYGLKTKKGRITRHSGGKQLYEEFHYLKEYLEPNVYVK